MLAFCALTITGANPDPGAQAFAPRGQTFDLPLDISGTWTHWNGSFGTSWNTAFGWQFTSPMVVQARWRASKGSAPVGRFTRAIGNNNTEGWHRTMPVATSTVVTVPVPAVFLRDLVVAPSVAAGSTTIAAPATTIRLVAIAPSISVATQIAVPSSRITLNAVAPARTTTVTLTVPAVAVRDVAIAPTVVPGTRTLTPQIGGLRLLAIAPQVQNFILVPAATLRLLAVAPSVTGGGGGGGTVTLRKSGD